jgi:hypothetical protein
MTEVAPIVSTLLPAPRKERRVKRLEAGCRVSGSFGDYIPNPNPNIKRRIRMKLYGTIVRAVDKKQYEVLWDNNNTSIVFANSLAKETSFASLPPSAIALRQQDNPEMPPTGQEVADAEEEEIINSQRDQEPTEHLPFAGQPVGGECFSSDEESNEEAAEEEASQGGDPAVRGTEEGGGEAATEQPATKKRRSPALVDPEGRMPGQLPTAEALPKDYNQRKSDAISVVKSMLGRQVTIKHKSKTMKWLVVDPFVLEDEHNNNVAPSEPVGLKLFKSTDYSKETVMAELFLHLAFDDWRLAVAKINEAVEEQNNNNNKKKVRPFTDVEFLLALAIFIGAAEFGVQGINLWKEGDKIGGEDEEWATMIPHPEFDKILKLYRWKEFRHFLPFAFQEPNLKLKDDPWWKFDGAIEAFNSNRYKRVQSSQWLVMDESMSAWRPRTTPTGGLPNLSFILRKPEPLGKCLCCFLLFVFQIVLTLFLFFVF